MKKSKPKKLGAAKTLRAAAGRTGLPPHVIQGAKDAGCPAFRSNGTVDCDELVEFVASQPPSTATDSEPDYYVERARDIRANRMLKEQRLAERSKELVPRERLRSAWYRNVISCKTKFYNSETGITTEATMRLGLNAEQMSMLKEIVMKHQRIAIRELNVGEWGTVVCPMCKQDIIEQK